MAFDSEQFKRRRELREQQRREKAARAKKMRIIGLICGCAALVIGVLVLVLSLRSCETQPNQPQTTQPPPDTTTIHFAATGDLNITEKVVASGRDEDYTELFMDVAPLLAQADITTVNLEGGLYGAPYGVDASAPPALADALKNAGVDLVQLANSYAIVKGTAGLAATVNGIQSAGLTPVGAYADAKAARDAGGYTIREVDGIKIAFVAFTKGMDGMALPAGSEGCVNLLYTDYASSYQEVDTAGITAVLKAAAREKPDLTVALLHWGSEYNDTISTSQEAITKLLLENGVDAIIGTHSHYVQKMVYDESAGTFVAYSLGDFLGDADRPGSEYSVILDLEITKNHSTGDTRITGYSYTPIFTDSGEDRVRLLRIESAMAAYEGGYLDKVSDDTYAAMQYALKRIEARIKGE